MERKQRKEMRLSKYKPKPFWKETRRLPRRENERRVTAPWKLEWHHGNRDCMEKLSFEKKPMVKKGYMGKMSFENNEGWGFSKGEV